MAGLARIWVSGWLRHCKSSVPNPVVRVVVVSIGVVSVVAVSVVVVSVGVVSAVVEESVVPPW
eukprot:354569-Chlamydomonas_euryale.AAC.9